MIAWAALGKSVLKGGVKKVATDKLLNRKKKTNKRRASVKKMMGMDGKEKEGGEKKGGALAVRPSMDLIPSSKKLDPLSDTAGDSDIVIIKKQVIQVRDILKDSYTIEQEERLGRRKAKQTDKRRIREDKLEKPKVKPTESKGMKGPSLGGIGNYFSWLAFGIILNKLMALMPSLKKILSIIKPIAKFIIGAFEKMVGFIIGFIDLSYAGVEKLREGMVAIGGEGAGELFDKFGKLFTQVINGALIAAMIGGRIGLLSKAASLLGFGKGAAATAAAGGATTTTAATVGGVSAGVAAAVVAAAGAIAVGLGEGIFALGEKGYNIEQDWKQKADKKWWTDPRKYWWGISAGLMGFTNRIFSAIGGIFDIVGAPFRMIAELIRFPFLSEEGKEKQRTNLEKYDARIREQFRKALNMFDFLGVIDDDKGSWGSLYGETATDKMGFTKDGKTKSQQVPAKKGTILLSTPDLVATQDLLQGKKSGEKVHSILKISSTSKEEGLDTHPSYAHGGMIVVENTTTYIQPIEV